MNRYRLIRQKTFESIENYEDRLNKECGTGWRISQFAGTPNALVALLEREQNH